MPSQLLRSLFAAAFLAHSASAQTFNPKMPASVPEVTGPVVENLAMHYIDIAVGSGAFAAPGKQYTVHYTGWLRDGKKFDSSVDRKEPLKFVHGRRLVIAGWETGFEGMKVGGKRRLFIPYQLAYGEQGNGPIPPKSELIFDVELLDVADVPVVLAAADILLPFSESESKVIALAKAVPEDKLSWRPAPGVRSLGEVFIHIAYGNKLLLNIANTAPSREALQRQIEEQSKNEKQAVTKERLLQLLSESFAEVRKSLESARPGTLAREADLFGTQTTRRAIFVFLEAHISEHLGQAIAYARMNGITPPWSEGAR
jgi:uncharacterized damage-inducible protein DinB